MTQWINELRARDYRRQEAFEILESYKQVANKLGHGVWITDKDFYTLRELLGVFTIGELIDE